MEALILIAALGAGLGLALGLPRWRLKRALARPMPAAWTAHLQRNIPMYARMSGELQHQLGKLVQQFIYQKKFVGCAGLEIDDEMRVTIAGQACLLLLYRQESVMDHYGATNEAEFFAVATETFFEKPWQLAERHPDLFRELFKFYKVDPRAWLPQAQREPEMSWQQGYGAWQ